VTPSANDAAAPPVSVLLVDDQAANLLALEAVLQAPGLILVRAASGEEALRRLLHDDFAVVLLDVQMAGLDGFETAQMIRARRPTAHTPIIFLTAYDSPTATSIRAYSLGAVDYLVKPIVPEIVRAKVAVFVELFRRAERIGHLERAAFEQRLADERQRWELDRLREEARRRDEFLAMLSHELRNPLAPMRNATQILRLKCHGDPVVANVSALLERQVGHMTRLVDDLLDVSRITRGKVELKPEAVDLAKVVAHAAESVRPQLDECKQRLEVSLPAEPLRLFADPVRLEQVFTNLLVNAGKFTDPGGTVTVSVARAGDEAAVHVADTGIGIRADLLPRVFDLFQQGEARPGRVSEGLGLGLALVKRLTEMHGGTVTAHSDGPGLGSEFMIRLPLATGAREQASPCPLSRQIAGD
jgi:signal transduction histidine kinase